MEKYYRIAGLTVAMDTFGRTEKQAAPYLIDAVENPDIRVISLFDEAKCRYPDLTDDYAEHLGTSVFFYKELLKNYSGFLLHSSAVVMHEKAYLFSVNSGTGKSTHTSLWLKQFGDQAYILNDDKPAVRLIDGIWYAFGTPWSGKNDISVNEGVPIAGICMLERGEKNEVERFNGKKAIFEIYAQTNRPRMQEYRIKLLELLDDLITNVPVWKMKCNMDPEAAQCSYEAMSFVDKEEKYEKEFNRYPCAGSVDYVGHNWMRTEGKKD